jgi:ribosomal protein S18 acetylase RimI-like enzyme
VGLHSSFLYTTKIAEKDIPEIASFISEIFRFNTLGDWVTHLSNIWRNNPAFHQKWDRGILLRSEEQIVGFLAKFPTKMQFNGKEMLVANASNLSVHKDFRRKGIGTRLREEYANSCKDTIMFATTPGNDIARRINEKVGFRPLHNDVDPIYEIDSVIITNALKAIRLSLIVQRLSKHLSFASVILSLLLKAFNALQLIRFKKSGLNKKDIAVMQLASADDSFDRLWEETKDYYMLTNVRTADVINWHLNLNPKSKKRLYACYGSGNLLGYMIIGDIRIRNVDLKYCFDVWFKKGHEYIIESIVNFILKQEETQHYGAIILPHFNILISKYLSSIGLFKVKGRKIKNYYSAPKWIEEKLAPDNCYLVHIQGDRGISAAI